jgi:tRNA pseudouridine55 synthase
MYSALKLNGRPLYELARQGKEVERAARPVRIHQFSLLAVEGAHARFQVRCSKGTYIRTLAEDLARAIGSCAHLTALRRHVVEPFPAGALVTLEQVESDPASVPLLSPDAALPQLPCLALDRDEAVRLRQGQAVRPVAAGKLSGGLVRLYDPAGGFLGIGSLESGAFVLKPVRLFNDLAPVPT